MKNFKSNTKFIFKGSSEVYGIKSEKLSGLNEKVEAEVAQIDIDDLVEKSNKVLKKNEDRIQKLPKEFQEKMSDRIAKYMIDSANRYDKDSESGLNLFEFEKFSWDMILKIQDVVDQYAPSEEMIERLELRSAAESKFEKEIQKKSKEIKDIKNLDIPDPSTLDLSSPEEIYDEVGNYNLIMGVFQEKSAEILNISQDFMESYENFETEKNSYGNLLANMFTFGIWDKAGEGEDLKEKKDFFYNKIAFKKAQIEIKKQELNPYEKALINAPEKLSENEQKEKEKKIRALESSGRNLEETKEGSEQKKNQIEDQQEKLRKEKDKILQREEYFAAVQEKMEGEEINLSFAKERLESGSEMIRSQIIEIEESIKFLPEGSYQRAMLERKKNELINQSESLSLNIAYLGENSEEIQNGQKNISEEFNNIQRIEGALFEYDSTLANSVSALDFSINSLEIEKLKNGTVLQELEAGYIDKLQGLSELDKAIDDNILDNNLSLDSALINIDEQKEYINDLPIEGHSWWSATFGFVGKGVSDVTGYVGSALEWTADICRKVPVVGEYVLAPVLDFSAGIVEGAGELVSGVTQIIAHPIDSLENMKPLIGFDPETGDYSWETSKNAWKSVGESFIALDEFQEGDYAKGAGKAAVNVVTTFFSGGSVGIGKSMANSTRKVAKALGKPKLLKSILNSTRGTRRVISENMKKGIKGTGETAKAVGEIGMEGAGFIINSAKKTGALFKKPILVVKNGKNMIPRRGIFTKMYQRIKTNTFPRSLLNSKVYKKNLKNQFDNINKAVKNTLFEQKNIGKAIKDGMSPKFLKAMKSRFENQKLQGKFDSVKDFDDLLTKSSDLKEFFTKNKPLSKKLGEGLFATDKGIQALSKIGMRDFQIITLLTSYEKIIGIHKKINTVNKGLILSSLQRMKNYPGKLKKEYASIRSQIKTNGGSFSKPRALVQTILDQFPNKIQQSVVALMVAHSIHYKDETEKQAQYRRKIIEEKISDFVAENDISEFPDIFEAPKKPNPEPEPVVTIEGEPPPENIEQSRQNQLQEERNYNRNPALSGKTIYTNNPKRSEQDKKIVSKMRPISPIKINSIPTKLGSSSSPNPEPEAKNPLPSIPKKSQEKITPKTKKKFSRRDIRSMFDKNQFERGKGHRMALLKAYADFERGQAGPNNIMVSNETGKNNDIEILFDKQKGIILTKTKGSEFYVNAKDKDKKYKREGDSFIEIEE